MHRKIAHILAEREPQRINDSQLTPSAVLMLLYEKEGEYHVIFTKRTDIVAHHKGQICFVGGARDEDDTDILHTALREAEEELGIKPEDVEILGQLDDIFTVVSNFLITPFVGKLPYPYPLKPNQDEIAQVIETPLKALIKSGVTEETEMTWKDVNVKVYYFYYEDHIIWGATARILRQFLDLIKDS